ncbi:hypothetical protein [Thiosocius teredinicola]|uniref:hypothetical protein n=1 Tax=Thiosocius teredinicola TaxID=1973002 RepID=UPI000F7B0F71
MNRLITIGGFSAAIALSGYGHAALITEGLTYTVASAPSEIHTHSDPSCCDSSPFGNPPDKAEVGAFSGEPGFVEEIRGFSEFDLTGVTSGSPAYLTFDVYNDGGLFLDVAPVVPNNDFPFFGPITIEAFEADGNFTFSDVTDNFFIATSIVIDTFDTSPLSVGDILSFDVQSVVSDAIDNGWSALGVRLRADPVVLSGAWTFDQLGLTTTDESTGVPLPATFAFLLIGVAAMGASRKQMLT